jgi:hypothetical protein
MKRTNINSRNYSLGTTVNFLTRALIVAGFLFGVFNGVSQNAPVLAITSVASNQMTITITNGNGGAYDLYSTPVLANAAYPWTAAMIGTNGQTNFTVNLGPYPAGFYEAIIDTNAIPIWELADPNNPGAGILTVFIDNPTNGMVLQ